MKEKKEDKQRSGKIETIKVIKKEKIERKKRKRNKIGILEKQKKMIKLQTKRKNENVSKKNSEKF